MKLESSSLLEGIVAGFSFGTASIFVRFLILFHTNTYTIAFYRLFVASAILGLIIYIQKRFSESLSKSSVKNNLKYIVLMGFLIGLHFIFFISAVRDTYIVNATVLVNTTPILALFLSMFFKIKTTKEDVLTVVIAFLGVLIISFQDIGFKVSLLGDIEAVIAAFLLAFYINIGKKIREEVNVLYIMSIIYLIAVIPIFLVGFTYGIDPLCFPISIDVILLLIAVGVIPTALGHTLYISSLKNLKPFETATLALLEPISASILAYFLFLEIPNIFTVLGASLVLFSIAIITYKEALSS